MQGARVQSLVRELRSHMLQGKAKKKKKKTWALGQMKKSEAKSDLLRKKTCLKIHLKITLGSRSLVRQVRSARPYICYHLFKKSDVQSPVGFQRDF